MWACIEYCNLQSGFDHPHLHIRIFDVTHLGDCSSVWGDTSPSELNIALQGCCVA